MENVSNMDFILVNQNLKEAMAQAEYRVVADDTGNTSFYEPLMLKIVLKDECRDDLSKQQMRRYVNNLIWNKCNQGSLTRGRMNTLTDRWTQHAPAQQSTFSLSLVYDNDDDDDDDDDHDEQGASFCLTFNGN